MVLSSAAGGGAAAVEGVGLAGANGTDVALSFSGVPGRPYRVQYTPSLLPPVTWQTFGTNVPAADGLFQCMDTNGWGQRQRFYRLIWP